MVRTEASTKADVSTRLDKQLPQKKIKQVWKSLLFDFMLSHTDALKEHQKLAQFWTALAEFKFTDEQAEWLFSKSDVNSEINRTSSCFNKFIGKTALHLAFESPSVRAFEYLLRQGADFLVRDEDDSTIAHLALKSSKKIFVNMVLSMQMKTENITNYCNNEGISHFHAACMANNVEAVEYFLNHGVFIHHTVNKDSSCFAGFSPLHFASRYCSLEVTELLIKRGADVFMKDNKGRTPIHVALEDSIKDDEIERNIWMEDLSPTSKSSWDKMKQLLISHILDAGKIEIDDSGFSCFHVACTLANSSIAQRILREFTNMDIDHSVRFESNLWPGFTALHFAVYSNLEMINWLVSKEADLNVKDPIGQTPIHMFLKRYKADVICSILTMEKTWKNLVLTDKKTKVLHFISAMEDYSTFSKFLKRLQKNVNISIPIDSPIWPGYTLLHLAVLFYAANKDVQVIKDLIERDINFIEAQDGHGQTPLHICFRHVESTDLLNLLLKSYEKLDNPRDIADEDNLSILHIACAQENENLVKKLLTSSSNYKFAYKGKPICNLIETGWTPLDICIARNSKNAILSLLIHGLDLFAKNENDRAPISMVIVHTKNSSQPVRTILFPSKNLDNPRVINDSKVDLGGRGYREVNAVQKILDIKRIETQASKLEAKDFAYQAICDERDEITDALRIALESNYSIKVIDLLIQNGANIFAKSSSGVPLLYEYYCRPSSDEYQRYFASLLEQDVDLYERVHSETGLTKLHVACAMNDIDHIKRLLDNGARVNAKINFDSPIWPGETPLHLLIPSKYTHGYDVDKNIQDSMQLILSKGADVTLSNAKQATPIHIAFDWLYVYPIPVIFRVAEKPTKIINILLNAQKDFSMNPANPQRMTHFHVACYAGNVFVVEKYLQQNVRELSHPIDFFYDLGMKISRAGSTPLHFALMNLVKDFDITTQLEIVDLLLKHGADVNAQDSRGDTPLHLAKRNEVIERIFRGGADLSIINAYSYTPMECSGKFSTENLKNLIRNGFYYNVFSIRKKEGYIARTLCRCLIRSDDMKLFMSTIVSNFPQSIKTDEMGRTAVHNIVSIDYLPGFSVNEYAALIEQLSKTGCDVDNQDKSGRTALHIAVKFNNFNGILGLLMAGADVNIMNIKGQTPMAYSFEKCSREELDRNQDDECEHHRMFKTLAVHVKKLQICNLDICEFNQIRLQKAFELFKSAKMPEMFFSELEDLENVKIEGFSTSLRNLLSETDIVADYPTMSQIKRNAIDRFFHPSEIQKFREKFDEVAGIIQLQYRKAVRRSQLVEETKGSMKIIVGFRLPEICFHIIVKSLTNTDLKNLIASTIL